mmetsp:Transcript_24941/g.57617  ORF Transcript_24941/g.57617 Transcript_24941/m.57617 type:complete len:87 (+) Transcript_24941:690-950(+)
MNCAFLILVDCRCGPCQFIAPVFEKMAQDYPDVEFVKVDVDDANDVSSKCGIRSMPTFQFYKGGEKVDDFSGANKDILEKKVKSLM